MPNLGNPLCDSFLVASCYRTFQCSPGTPWAMRIRSAAIQLRGRPWPEKRAVDDHIFVVSEDHAAFVSSR